MVTSQNTFKNTNDFMVLDEDMPGYGRAMYLFLSVLLGSLLHHLHFHDDATLVMRLSGLLILGPIICWFVYLALWRKQVTINFARKKLFVRSGPVVLMRKKSYDLSRYRKLDVSTKRTFTINVDSAPGGKRPDKITRKYYLVGPKKLHVATRCYSSNDRESKSRAENLEREVKQNLGRLWCVVAMAAAPDTGTGQKAVQLHNLRRTGNQ